MTIKDFIIAPIFLLFITFLLFYLRNSLTTSKTRKYFFPAIYLKLFGALALGVIYFYYYGGGDTINYFNQSKVIYEAFWDSPNKWWRLLLANGEYIPDLAEYTGRMYWYDAPREYTVIKFAGFFSVFSGGSYVVISFWFAIISFLGLWSMFVAMIDLYPKLIKEFAIAIFFLPSVIFWGSGLMKDTLSLAGIGWLFSGFYYLFIKKEKIIQSIIAILFATYLTLSVKPYVFFAFAPASSLWIFNQYSANWNKVVRYFFLLFLGGISLILMTFIVNLEEIARETKIQADWISYASERDGGATYSLGTQDGTFAGMLKLFVPAVNVSLFRPYLFEARNPVMLLSALEATFFLLFTIQILFKVGISNFFKIISSNPLANFSLIFAIIFAFFIGVSSYNFGSLVRYKIPLMPFYVIGIYIIQSVATKKVKV